MQMLGGNMMKVLVTGGSGFIGKYVVDEIIRNGHAAVIVDNLSNGDCTNMNPKAVFYDIDVKDNMLEKVFMDEKPDKVIHLAAQINVSKSLESPAFDADVNILGTINTLECCIKSGVSKIIYSSSAAVYGNPLYLGVDENHPINPISFYGISKLVGEWYIMLYSKLYGMNYTIFRFSNVYGNCNKLTGEGGVIYQFINSIMNQRQPVIFGNGEQTRDLIYVKDVASACYLALHEECSELFNLGTGIQTSINQLLSIIYSKTGSDIAPEFLDFKMGDILHSYFDNSKVTDKLNWAPKYTLEDGMGETLNSMQLGSK